MKRIHKRVLRLLSLLVVATLLFSACGSSAAKEDKGDKAAAESPTSAPTAEPTAAPTEAPTPEPTAAPVVLEDRNGFSEETNQELSFAGIRFYIPDYYKTIDSKVTDTRLEYTCTGILDENNSGLILEKSSTNWSKVDYEKNIDELERRFLSNIEYTKVDSKDVTIGGFLGRLITLNGNTENTAGRDAQAAFTYNDITGEFVLLIIVQQTEKTSFDYFPDFERILDSAVIEEKPVSAGVTPEFKATMDSYEAFIDKYVEFMKNYDTMDTSQMLQYLSILSEYTDFAQKIDAIDEDSLSDADYAYYLEVTTRVSQKLLSAAG